MVFSDGLYAYSDIMTTWNELTVLLHLLMYFLLKEEDWFLSKQNQSILLDEDSSIIFILESENYTFEMCICYKGLFLGKKVDFYH